VITVGLIIFAVGSVVAASSHDIWGVIIGRALQGAGAIAAALMALLADLTREEIRTRATAMIGMSIGMSFTVSLILGPWLDAVIGVNGIFWLTAVLATGAIVVLHTAIPTPDHSSAHRDAETVPAQLGGALRNIELLRLDFGILVLHAIMTAMFIAYNVLEATLPSLVSRIAPIDGKGTAMGVYPPVSSSALLSGALAAALCSGSLAWAVFLLPAPWLP